MAGCARQSNPTGGPIDEQPPQVISYNPPLFTTHFSKNGFVIEFDEYVKLDNMSSQLVISPPLSALPNYAIRGKRILVDWKDTLQPNSTYQFNFGSAIVDVNEGNPNSDLVYVFSTGAYIDSLHIAGEVINRIDNVPLPGAAVMLYHDEADSLPITQRPDYFAMTDEEGKFEIKYLPPGDFKVFVLKEEQKNYIYNGPPEIIGFLDQRITSTLNDTAQFLIIPAFVEEDTMQYVSARKETDFGYYEMVFNKPVESPEIEFVDIETQEELSAQIILNDKKDTLKAWVDLPKREDLDEVAVYLSYDEMPTDTAYWYIESNPKFKQKSEFKVNANLVGNKLDLKTPLQLYFNNPIVSVDTSFIEFMEDSVAVSPVEIEKSNHDLTMSLLHDFKTGSQYIFHIYPGAFTDVFGATNDSLSAGFSLRDTDYYGSLTLNISVPIPGEGQRILQLLDSKDNIIQERTFDQTFSGTFSQLHPGKYFLKVIFDENENGKWDTGVYRDKIQPEKLSVYPEEIEIRSNWEFDLEWTPTTPFD